MNNYFAKIWPIHINHNNLICKLIKSWDELNV